MNHRLTEKTAREEETKDKILAGGMKRHGWRYGDRVKLQTRAPEDHQRTKIKPFQPDASMAVSGRVWTSVLDLLLQQSVD